MAPNKTHTHGQLCNSAQSQCLLFLPLAKISHVGPKSLPCDCSYSNLLAMVPCHAVDVSEWQRLKLCLCDNNVDSAGGTPPLFALSFSAFLSVFCQLLPASFSPYSTSAALCTLSLGVGLLSLSVFVPCGSVCSMSRRWLRFGATSAADKNTFKHTPLDIRKPYQ